MPHRIGHGPRERGGIKDQDRPADRRHRKHHYLEQVRAAHPGEIGAHHQRALDHAEKHVRTARQTDDAADPERSAQEEGQAIHKPAQYAPVPQQGGKRGEDDHQRQDLKGDHHRGGHAFLERERQRGTAEITEHVGRAVERRALDRSHDLIGERERIPDDRHTHDQQREERLQGNRACDPPP